jgi:hypothetical protein
VVQTSCSVDDQLACCRREAAEVTAKLMDSVLLNRIQEAVSANSPTGIAIAQIRERLQGRRVSAVLRQLQLQHGWCQTAFKKLSV